MNRRIGVLIAVLICGVTCLAVSARAEPLRIRIGWNNALSHPQPFMDMLVKKHPELFPHYGKSYVAEGLRFQGGPLEMQALAAGELDVIAFNSTAFALAITNAHLDLRIVADVLQNGVPGYAVSDFIVRADSPIKSVEDLKGKRIATNTIGSSIDAALRTMLHRHGIADNEFTEIEANFSNMPAMIEGGKVDLVPSLPVDHYLVESGKYRVLFTMTQAVGPEQTVLWAMSRDYIAAHRPALVDFFEDHLRALRWLLDPAHHEAVVDMAQALTKLPRDRLEFIFTKKDSYRAPDGIPNIAAAQHEIDEMFGLKLLPKRIELRPDYVDLSMVREAYRRLTGK